MCGIRGSHGGVAGDSFFLVVLLKIHLLAALLEAAPVVLVFM
jgi:hypothetical protein